MNTTTTIENVVEEFNIFEVTADPNEIVKKQKKPNDNGKLRIIELYKYCNMFEYALLIIGIFGDIANGALFLLIVLLIGDMMDSLNPFNQSNGINPTLLPLQEQYKLNGIIIDNIDEEVMAVVYKLAWLALANFIGGLIKTISFYLLSERQGIKIRKLYFKSLLRQDCNWYDFYESGELSARVASDVKLIQEGIGNKIGQIFNTVASFLTGYIVAFVKCWDLALVVLSTFPLMVISMILIGKITSKAQNKQQNHYGNAGAIGESVIGNIRTVKSLNQEESFSKEYSESINNTKKYGIIKSIIFGFGFGAIFLFLFGANALGMWYGLIIMEGKGGSKDTSTGAILTVFMSLVLSSQTLSQVAIPIGCVSSARSVAYRIFKTIERIPDIDSLSIGGLKPNQCDGNIEIEGIHFAYPTRPTKQILKGLDLKIRKGETIALVGASGCGKSTIIQLIQRFYDPTFGKIMMDGIDIKNLNIKWLRNRIGIVSQEPVLFSMSISDNIKLGWDENDVDQQTIDEVCKMANCYDFITELPEGFNTIIGERGASLSGGQKQRIAIARALIKNPKILLLDEATSALDTQSEKIVQEALEKASQGRTTIIIAHRLTTVRNASRICVFHQGEIIESGTHQELMDLKGSYFGLVKRQCMEEEVDQEKVEEDHKRIQEEKGIVLKERNNSEENENKERGNEEIDKEGIKELQVKEEKEKKERKENGKRVIIKIIGENIKKEWIHIVIALIGAIGLGAVFPLFIFLAIQILKTLSVIVSPSNVTQEIKDEVFEGCMKIVGIALVAFVSNNLYFGQFGISSLKLIIRKRIQMFSSIIKQEIGWFDRKENSVGILSTQLASQPNAISGISAERIGDVFRVISTVGCGLGIALTYDYRIALCILCICPIGITCFILDSKFNKSASSPSEKAYNESNNILVQSIESIKTVQNLGKELHFYHHFEQTLIKPSKNIWKWAPFLALLSSIPVSIPFCAQAFGWSVSLHFLKKDVSTQQNTSQFITHFLDQYINILTAMMSMVSVLKGIVDVGVLMPDIGKSISSSRNVKRIVGRTSFENQNINSNSPIKSGDVEFKNVYFRYPTRIQNQILKGISFKAEQGKTIALVGASGCGKSTTIQLIERFYDPTFGNIMIDGMDVKDLNIKQVRNQIGLVGQEPILFNESVIDNIKRGIPSGMNITNEQIYEVCKMANAHDFISAMPEGYNTMVGDRGSQLSGGQKQRIAIARALIKNPKILLLDEATSALDSESEKIVQEALEKASQGRTTIIIAHRLSTIQNADNIYVIMRGKIAECGTHQELMDLKGFYYTLAMQQFGK